MALGDYLASLNLSPDTTSKLGTMIGPPAEAVDPYGAPTPEEMSRYGVPADAQAAAQRYNAPSATPPQAATNPVAADPKWTPDGEAAKTGAEQRRKAESAATPQGPAGSDGFPTYRDLSNTGSAMPAAPSGPQQVIKAHWSPSTRGDQVHEGLSKEAMRPGQEYREEAHIQGQLANQAQLGAAEQQGMADAVYAAAHAKASQDTAAEMRRLENEKRAYVQAEQEKLNNLAVKAQEKIDPDAAKGSGGAQLMSAIAIAMGQFGASLNGGQNAALQIVQSNIDRNIAAQRDNIANAGKAHDREQSLYKQNLDAFGDKERATLATKVQYLDQVKAMADQQYAAAKHSANEAQYHAFNEKLMNERAKTLDEFAAATEDRHVRTSQDKFMPATVVGGAGGAKGKEGLFVPTLGGYARDPETAKKLNTEGSIRMQINNDLHTIDKLLNEAKGLNSVSDYGRMQEIRQEIASRKNNVLQRTTVLRGQGAMSNGDKDVAEIGAQLLEVDPQLKTAAQIERMRKGVKNVAVLHQTDHRLSGEANGVQLGREEYRQGPHGPEPVAKLQGANKVVTKRTESVDDLLEKPKGEVKK